MASDSEKTKIAIQILGLEQQVQDAKAKLDRLDKPQDKNRIWSFIQVVTVCTVIVLTWNSSLIPAEFKAKILNLLPQQAEETQAPKPRFQTIPVVN